MKALVSKDRRCLPGAPLWAARACIALGVATALLLPAGIAAAQSDAKKPLQVVRLGDQTNAEVDYAAVWVADELGYFADEGIKIERRSFANGPASLLEFANGNLDATMAGLAPFMQFAAGGGQFKMVMSVTKGNAPLVGLKKYNSYADLNGKKIGTPGLGTIHDAVIFYVEQTKGYKYQRISGKVTDLAIMVSRGEADAFIAWEPASALAIAQNPELHYVAQMPPIKNLESLELVVQPTLASEKPEIVYGMVRAILRGIAYLKNNPPEKSAELIAKKMGNPKLVPVVMNAFGSVILTEPRVDMPSTRLILQTIAKQGKISPDLVKDVDGWVGKYLDYSFLDRAEKSLAQAK